MNIDFAAQIVKKTNSHLLRDYREVKFFNNSASGAVNFIANAKKRTEEILVSNFVKYFPDHKIIAKDSTYLESHIVIQALEGEENIQNGLPFFGVIVLAKTVHRNTSSNYGIISLPCLDQVVTIEPNQIPILEDLVHSTKIKSKLSEANVLMLTNLISPALITQIKDLRLDTKFLRAFASNAYSIMLMLQGKAGSIIANKLDLFSCRIFDLFILGAGGYKINTQDFCIYSSKKLITL